MVEESKQFWKSKTLWVNVLFLGGVVFTELSNVLGAEGTVTVAAILNIILRTVTKNPLKWKI